MAKAGKVTNAKAGKKAGDPPKKSKANPKANTTGLADERFEMLFNRVTNLSVQGYGPDGKVRYWNKASEKLYGYKAEEAIGRNLVDLIIPDNMKAAVKQAVKRMIKQGKGEPAEELLLKRKDGTLVPVFSNHTIIKTATGGTELFCIDIDLSEQKKARHRLDKVLASLKERVKEQTCLYAIANLSNRQLTIAELLQKALSYIPAGWQYPGLTVAAVEYDATIFKTPKFKKTAYTLTVSKKTAEGKELTITVAYLKKPPHLASAPFLKEERQLINMIATNLVLNINQIVTLRNLEESRQRLSTILNSEPECVKVVAPNGKLIDMNPAGLDMISAKGKLKELVGQPVKNMVAADDWSVYRALHEGALKGKQGSARFRLKGLKGTERWVESIAVPLKDSKGKITSVLSVARDVSRRIKAEQDLERIKKNQEALINGTTDLVWSVDTEMRVIVANRPYLNMLSTAYGRPAAEGDSAVTEKFGEGAMKAWLGYYRRGLAGESFTVNGSYIDRNTYKRHYSQVSFSPILNEEGQVAGLACYMKDVTDNRVTQEIEKLERELMAQSTKESTNLPAQLGDYLKGLESLFPGMKATVLKVEDGKVWGVAAPSFSSEFAQTFNGEPIGEKAGSCGTAAYTKKTVIVSSIATDPLWEKYKDAALSQGLRACWSQPIFNSKGDVIATFANYYSIEKSPTPKELEIFNRSASILGLVMENYTKSWALAQSHERYEMVTQATSDAIWDLDMINNKLYWSEGFKKLFGYEINDVDKNYEVGKAALHPEDAEKVGTTMLKVVNEGGSTWQNEYRFRKADGTYAYVSNRAVVMRNAQGRPYRIVGAVQDVTKKKEAELGLKKAYEEKMTILESIGDGFFTLDKSFVVTYWNHMAEELLQVPRAMLLGKNIWEVFVDATDLPSYHYYNRAMKEGVTVHFDDYYAPINKWFEISAYPSEKGLSVYFKDVSSRKQAEEQIRLSNERFEKAAEATNDAIWDWEIEKGTLYWGKGFTTLFGYEVGKGPVPLESWSQYLHPEDHDRALNSLHEASRDPHATGWRQEYRYRKLDGSYAYVVDRGVVIRNEAGQAVRMVGAMTDITHRKQYEDSLKELTEVLQEKTVELSLSNKELEQFAYVASHDLQEPLRMVTSFLTKIEEKYEPLLDEKGKKYIRLAVDGAGRMRRIILDLLEYSRSGRLEQQPEQVDLNDVIAEVEKLNRIVIEEKKAKIVYGPLPVLSLPKVPVQQLFRNLINNSLKYSRADVEPVVEVLYKETDTCHRFEVKDNGIGISPQFHKKLFVLFQRLHNKSEYSGTGIGLAVCKKIVQRLGGEIGVESVENEGATFYFTIPKR